MVVGGQNVGNVVVQLVTTKVGNFEPVVKTLQSNGCGGGNAGKCGWCGGGGGELNGRSVEVA